MGKRQKTDKKGIIYSTNSDYEYDFDNEEVETLPSNEQTLKVMLDKKNRKGRIVTLITGFVGTNNDLKDLGKLLKSKCGVGGSAKDDEIIIQGDFIQKIKEILQKEGFKIK